MPKSQVLPTTLCMKWGYRNLKWHDQGSWDNDQAEATADTGQHVAMPMCPPGKEDVSVIALWSLPHPQAPLSGTKAPFQVTEAHRAHIHSGTREGPQPVLEAWLRPAGPTGALGRAPSVLGASRPPS